MQKILFLTCTILITSVTANACGGITIKGNSGASYCLSKHTMNWYSAYAWCHDQGMDMIDLTSVCKNFNRCPELSLSSAEKTHITDSGGTVGYVWVNTSGSSQRAANIELTYGSIGANGGANRNTNDLFYALCF